MNTAAAIIRDVEQAGGALLLEGEELRLRAPAPLPADILARLREGKAGVVAILRDGTATNWPEGLPRPAVKPGCDCALCNPTGHGYANQLEAARAISPEAFAALERLEAA